MKRARVLALSGEQSHLCYLSASCLGSLPPLQTGSRVTMMKGMMDISHSHFFFCKYLCQAQCKIYSSDQEIVLVSQS